MFRFSLILPLSTLNFYVTLFLQQTNTVLLQQLRIGTKLVRGIGGGGKWKSCAQAAEVMWDKEMGRQ